MLYVGDSIVDYQYANNFGIKLVICKYGYEKENVLETFKNTIFIDKPLDLLDVVRKK